MVKRKSRAARRDQRKRALKAEERGLPSVQEGAPTPKARKVRGDVAAAALASDKRPRGQRASRLAKPAATGLPVFAKVLVGAAAALVVVYALSQFRKSDSARAVEGRGVSSEIGAEPEEPSDNADIATSDSGEGTAASGEEADLVQQEPDAAGLDAADLAADPEFVQNTGMNQEAEVASPLEPPPPPSARRPELAPPPDAEPATPSE